MNHEPEIWTPKGIIRGEKAKIISDAIDKVFSEDEGTIRAIRINDETDDEEDLKLLGKIHKSMSERGKQALKE